MKTRLAIIFVLSAALIGCNQGWAKKDYKPLPEAKRAITVTYSPTCGCCKKWLSHLEEHDFKITGVVTKDMKPVKKRLGVPEQMASCHTAEIDGYVIEGHVPAQDIVKLLHERPQITGLSVPAMPVGTPGMEFKNRKDPFMVVAFTKEGRYYPFNKYTKY